MKPPFFLTCLFAVLITTACGIAPQTIEATPVVITVEVTRITQITTTPLPTATLTPSPTPDEDAQFATQIAKRIGTPIVASDECYDTARTQRDLNGCAGSRLGELQSHMAELVRRIETHYQQIFPEQLVKFQSYHAEWEDFSYRECMTRSGLDGDGWAGTMAPMNHAECLVSKYEDRLREYQYVIFSWTN